MDRSTRRGFYDVLSAAINDITEHGFDQAHRLEYWVTQLRESAERATTSAWRMEEMLRAGLGAIYRRLVDRGGIANYHPGVDRFTLQRLAPKLRAQLDKRILASANLIKLNRQQAIAKTLQRFQGWSTSIPVGGSDTTSRRETGKEIRKAITQLPFEERRVLIDQGHKLTASINEVVAKEGGAIALIWRSHWRQAGYDYREDHKDRDGQVYAIRGSWAMQSGLVKAGEAGYYDDITAVGEEIYCFPGDSKVPFADDVEKAFRRWYDGELVEFVTSSGNRLCATPNHPILTPDGFIAIGALNEGNDVVEVADELLPCLKENKDYREPLISEIFSTLNKSGIIETLNLRSANLDGNICGAVPEQDDVDIVFSTRPLTFRRKANFSKSQMQLKFADSNNFSAFRSSLVKGLSSLLHSANSFMSAMSKFPATFWAFLLHPNQHCVATASRIAPSESQVPRYDESRYSIFSRKLFDACSSIMGVGQRLPIENEGFHRRQSGSEVEARGIASAPKGSYVHADNWRDLVHGKALPTQLGHVVKINRCWFSGHVYNLQTASGWYVTQNVITHNCRCYAEYIYALRNLPLDMLTKKGEAELNRVRQPAA